MVTTYKFHNVKRLDPPEENASLAYCYPHDYVSCCNDVGVFRPIYNAAIGLSLAGCEPGGQSFGRHDASLLGLFAQAEEFERCVYPAISFLAVECTV